MAEDRAFVPFGNDAQKTARALLDAATLLDVDVNDVRTTSFGFDVPEEVAAKAADIEVADDAEPITDITAPVLSDPAAAEGAEFIENKDPGAGMVGLEDGASDEDVEIPEGKPTADWSHKELDAYAKANDVKFDSSTTSKAAKAEALNA